MNYGLVDTPSLNDAECLVLGLFCDGEWDAFAQVLDGQFNGLISRLFTRLKEKAIQPGNLKSIITAFWF